MAKYHREYTVDDYSKKEFFVAFVNLPRTHHLRELRTQKIGQLVAFSGTVTRTSEVRPELLFGTFVCKDCSAVVTDVEQQCRYTKPAVCPLATCGNRSEWELMRDRSKFVDWQRVRVQENAEEVPAGSLPRSIDVILRHEAVESARAGDKCIFTGTLVVVPELAPASMAGERVEKHAQGGGGGGGGRGANGGEGVGGLRSQGVKDLHYRMVFIAHSVVVHSGSGAGAGVAGGANIREEEGAELMLTDEEAAEVEAMRSDPDLYKNLVASVAPAVYGSEDVKRGVLLMLFGGGAQDHARGHQPEGGHQRGHRGRPVLRKVPVPEVRGRLPAPRRLHFRQVLLRRRPHRHRGQGQRDGRVLHRGGGADAGGQRHLLHRRV